MVFKIKIIHVTWFESVVDVDTTDDNEEFNAINHNDKLMLKNKCDNLKINYLIFEELGMKHPRYSH